MILKDLIAYLETKNPDTVLPSGFFHPHSYRGYYEDLAFEPKENVPIGSMLHDARYALGATFSGYKGGTYTMGEYTDCWLAAYGSTGDALGELVLDAMVNRAAFDALVGACQYLYAAMRAYEMDVDEPPPQKHREMMEHAHAALALAGVEP